jgi:tetratricopeptide (TPR) repeat protein
VFDDRPGFPGKDRVDVARTDAIVAVIDGFREFGLFSAATQLAESAGADVGGFHAYSCGSLSGPDGKMALLTPQGITDLGARLGELGRWNASVALYEGHELCVQEDPESLFYLGKALYMVGNDSRAEQVLARAMHINFYHPLVLEYMARVKERLGKTDEARKLYFEAAEEFGRADALPGKYKGPPESPTAAAGSTGGRRRHPSVSELASQVTRGVNPAGAAAAAAARVLSRDPAVVQLSPIVSAEEARALIQVAETHFAAVDRTLDANGALACFNPGSLPDVPVKRGEQHVHETGYMDLQCIEPFDAAEARRIRHSRSLLIFGGAAAAQIPELAAIDARINAAAAAGLRTDNNRDASARRGNTYTTQLLRYDPGAGGYDPHTDCGHGYQRDDRAATLLVYLSDVPEGMGGETEFSRISAADNGTEASSATTVPVVAAAPLRVRPETGKAILFDSLDESGMCDLRSEHAARPVAAAASGPKWVLQRWYFTRGDAEMGTAADHPMHGIAGEDGGYLHCKRADSCREYSFYPNPDVNGGGGVKEDL